MSAKIVKRKVSRYSDTEKEIILVIDDIKLKLIGVKDSNHGGKHVGYLIEPIIEDYQRSPTRLPPPRETRKFKKS